MCPRVGLLDHMETLFLVLRGASILFSIVAAPIYIQWPFLNSRIFQDSYFSSEKMSVEYEREEEVKLGARWQMGQKGQWPGVESVCSFSERQYCIRRLHRSEAEETSVQIPLMQLTAV